MKYDNWIILKIILMIILYHKNKWNKFNEKKLLSNENPYQRVDLGESLLQRCHWSFTKKVKNKYKK